MDSSLDFKVDNSLKLKCMIGYHEIHKSWFRMWRLLSVKILLMIILLWMMSSLVQDWNSNPNLGVHRPEAICSPYHRNKIESLTDFTCKDKKEHELLEMVTWRMVLCFNPDHFSSAWRIIFMVQDRVVNVMMMFITLECLKKDNSFRRFGKLVRRNGDFFDWST